MNHRPDVYTAACFSREHEAAGIAVCFRGGRLICADVVDAPDDATAHALAVLREVDLAASRFSHGALVLTSWAPLVQHLHHDPILTGAQVVETANEILAIQQLYPEKILIDYAPKVATRPAFIAARQILKGWIAGVEGGITWPKASRSALKEAA